MISHTPALCWPDLKVSKQGALVFDGAYEDDYATFQQKGSVRLAFHRRTTQGHSLLSKNKCE